GADGALDGPADSTGIGSELDRALATLGVTPQDLGHPPCVSDLGDIVYFRGGRSPAFPARWGARRATVRGAMCGIFGIYGHDEAASIGCLGLHSLRHRGQESPGIAAADEGRRHRQVAMGLVSGEFDEATLSRLPGRAAIGHVRYSTSGSSEIRNAQPF